MSTVRTTTSGVYGTLVVHARLVMISNRVVGP